jgi:hypothetical protein
MGRRPATGIALLSNQQMLTETAAAVERGMEWKKLLLLRRRGLGTSREKDGMHSRTVHVGSYRTVATDRDVTRLPAWALVSCASVELTSTSVTISARVSQRARLLGRPTLRPLAVAPLQIVTMYLSVISCSAHPDCFSASEASPAVVNSHTRKVHLRVTIPQLEVPSPRLQSADLGPPSDPLNTVR